MIQQVLDLEREIDSIERRIPSVRDLGNARALDGLLRKRALLIEERDKLHRLTPRYEQFRARCAQDAAAFERAAERARSRGDAQGLALANTLNAHAVKLRYLAAYEPEVAVQFEAETLA